MFSEVYHDGIFWCVDVLGESTVLRSPSLSDLEEAMDALDSWFDGELYRDLESRPK